MRNYAASCNAFAARLRAAPFGGLAALLRGVLRPLQKAAEAALQSLRSGGTMSGACPVVLVKGAHTFGHQPQPYGQNMWFCPATGLLPSLVNTQQSAACQP